MTAVGLVAVTLALTDGDGVGVAVAPVLVAVTVRGDVAVLVGVTPVAGEKHAPAGQEASGIQQSES
jgi:hypothetical protein